MSKTSPQWHVENWDNLTLAWLKSPEGAADARLIKAAPKLLKALKTCLHFCNPLQDKVIEQARAAIAEAEDES